MGDWRNRLRALVAGRRGRGAELDLHDAVAGQEAVQTAVEAAAPAAAGAAEALDTAAAATAEAPNTEVANTEVPNTAARNAAAESPASQPEASPATAEGTAVGVEVAAAEQVAVAVETAQVAPEAPTARAPEARAPEAPAPEAREPEPSPQPAEEAAAEAPTGPAPEAREPEAPAPEALAPTAPAPEAHEPERSPQPEEPSIPEAVAVELESLREDNRRLETALAEEREQRSRLQAEVTGLSDHDPLTGLVSARRFNDRLALAVTHSLRQKHKLAIVQLGLDRFEAIDGVGPGQGNDLLRSVALALESTLRQGDTIARLGADAVFTIMLPGVKHDDDVTVIADKLRLALRSPFSVGGSDLLVTSSIGIALFPDDGSDTDSLLRSAALAMERAREKGGDAWDVHAPESRARAVQRQARETALRRALVRGGLELYWQPVVTCDKGTIVGMESLLRWRGGERAPMPADFVTLADVSSLAVPLGQWLLRAACRQAGAWREQGHTDVVVSVGISARQLAHASFVKLVSRVLEEAALPASAIELEIPERELANAPELALARLADLRRLGIRVALDAFGTADSRVVDPHRYPLDTLKIDASVVREAVSSADRAAVIRACIALARSRRLRVVAAGVETEAHRALLVRLRCDQMQGRLCGPPLPAAEAEAALGARQDRPSQRAQGAGGRRLS